MFCVIQEVRNKKPNACGGCRRIEAYKESWTLEDKPARWAWRYTGGRFERPHLEAFKISLHQSYRAQGSVRKRQYSVTTMSYYDLLEFSLYDCASSRIGSLSKQLGVDEEELYAVINKKLTPLREHLELEFQQTEEYRTAQEHRQLLEKHREAQSAFCEQYSVDSNEYARCFDVFGQLRNKTYLTKVIRQHKAAENARRRYENYDSSTYNWGRAGSYGVSQSSTYTESETAILKQFYRTLSKAYHPDLNPGTDTKEAMQLLNKLKAAWGV